MNLAPSDTCRFSLLITPPAGTFVVIPGPPTTEYTYHPATRLFRNHGEFPLIPQNGVRNAHKTKRREEEIANGIIPVVGAKDCWEQRRAEHNKGLLADMASPLRPPLWTDALTPFRCALTPFRYNGSRRAGCDRDIRERRRFRAVSAPPSRRWTEACLRLRVRLSSEARFWRPEAVASCRF